MVAGLALTAAMIWRTQPPALAPDAPAPAALTPPSVPEADPEPASR